MKKVKCEIKIDFDRYWPYQLNNINNNVIAVERSKLQSINDVFKKYNGFENIPADNKIDGIILSYDNKKNTYTMDEKNILNNVPMQNLIVIEGYALSKVF